MDGYISILENYYYGCGLYYNLAQGSNTNKKTTSEVKTNNQKTYETIKTANLSLIHIRRCRRRG